MLLQIIQSSSSFGLFFPLKIHTQRGKFHFRSQGKNEESKRNETLLTYKSLKYTTFSLSKSVELFSNVAHAPAITPRNPP